MTSMTNSESRAVFCSDLATSTEASSGNDITVIILAHMSVFNPTPSQGGSDSFVHNYEVFDSPLENDINELSSSLSSCPPNSDGSNNSAGGEKLFPLDDNSNLMSAAIVPCGHCPLGQ